MIPTYLSRCQLCKSAVFPTRHFLISHYEAVHAINEFQLVYCFSEENDAKQLELADKLEKCISTKVDVPSPTIEVTPLQDTLDPTNNCPEVAEMVKNIFKIHSFLGYGDSPSSIEHDVVAPQTVDLGSPKIPEDGETETSTRSSALLRLEQGKWKTTKVRCMLCNEKFSSHPVCQTSHANFQHGHFITFKCGYCDKTFKSYKPSDVTRHILRKHVQPNGRVDKGFFYDYRDGLKAKLKELKDLCFPGE